MRGAPEEFAKAAFAFSVSSGVTKYGDFFIAYAQSALFGTILRY